MSVKYWCHDTPDKVCAKRNLNIPSPTLFFWQENSESHRKKNSCSKYSSNWFSNSPTSPEWWWQKLWSLSALTNSFCMVDASTRLRSNSWDIMSPCEPPPDQWFIGCTLSKATFFNAFVLDSFYWSVNRTAICFNMDPQIQPKYHVHPFSLGQSSTFMASADMSHYHPLPYM